MQQIELTQGMFALVDDEDFEELNQFNWCFAQGYAVRKITISGKRQNQGMHRLITNCPDGFEVDHINHDMLDNRKANLRVCRHSENVYNQKVRTYAKTSVYKGVYFHKRDGKWIAQIQLNNKRKFLGYFTNEIDAAIAYNVAAIELFGDFALLNEIG